MRRAHLLLIAGYIIFAALTCIAPPYPQELILQHIPTTLGLIILVQVQRRAPVSTTALVLVLVFMVLHAVGARYLYSYVPYDAWSAHLFGTGINEVFGFRRNHYDRLIHFSYGLLFLPVIREIALRRFGLRSRLGTYIAIEFIMATSMVYEVLEWLIAVFLSPEAAEAYNGQQGDMWDAQKDMALATVGALIAAAVVSLGGGRSTGWKDS